MQVVGYRPPHGDDTAEVVADDGQIGGVDPAALGEEEQASWAWVTMSSKLSCWPGSSQEPMGTNGTDGSRAAQRIEDAGFHAGLAHRRDHLPGRRPTRQHAGRHR